MVYRSKSLNIPSTFSGRFTIPLDDLDTSIEKVINYIKSKGTKDFVYNYELEILNEKKFAGYEDWRLPSGEEAKSFFRLRGKPQNKAGGLKGMQKPCCCVVLSRTLCAAMHARLVSNGEGKWRAHTGCIELEAGHDAYQCSIFLHMHAHQTH